MNPLTRRRLATDIIVFCLGILLLAQGLGHVAAANVPGQVAFAAKCASCHGVSGEGVTGKFEEPLHGELSIAELAAVIERTMPHERPDDCVGEEARQIERRNLAHRRRAPFALNLMASFLVAAV